MAAFKCDSCGAPIAPVQGERTVTCGYCGAHNRMGTMATMAMRVSSSRDPVKLGRVVVAMMLAPILVTFTIGIVVAVVIAVAANQVEDQVDSLPQLGNLGGLGGIGGSPSVAGWDRQSPLTCGINQTLRIDGHAALDTGPIVTGGINCKIEIVDADLSVAHGTLIDASSPNVEITIRNSTLRGDVIVAGATTTKVHVVDGTLEATRIAIQADGMSNDVRIEGASRIVGASAAITTSTSSNLTVGGTSRIESGSEAIQSGGGQLIVDGATVIGGRTAIVASVTTQVELRAGSKIESENGDAIRGQHNLRVRGRDATIRAGRDAIAGGTNANIDLAGGSVTGATAFRFDRNATLTLDGTTVQGERHLGARPRVTER